MQTYMGSLGCLCFGFMAAVCEMATLNSFQLFSGAHLTPAAVIQGCLMSAVVAAAVESLPIPEIDNVTVPLAAAVTATWAFSR